jgi:hypothetical protein
MRKSVRRRPNAPTVLSDRDRDIFLAALAADVKPNAAIRRAVTHYKRIVTSSATRH